MSLLEKWKQSILARREKETEPEPKLVHLLSRNREAIHFVLKRPVSEYVWRVRMHGEQKDRLIDVSGWRILHAQLRKWMFARNITWDDRRFNLNIRCYGSVSLSYRGKYYDWQFEKL
jgi:hypothetical protein